MAVARRFDPVGLLTLREIRSFIRRSSARGGVVFFGLLYVLGSLFLGGMIVLGDVKGGYTLLTLWSGSAGAWNYPGLLLIAPWGVVSLPFFATVAMVGVGVGVGYGMTVAFLLAVRLVRDRGRAASGSTVPGAFAGLTPALISLVTLGACCSTTAAATAGVGLVAQASGTTASNLLLNNWYLGVFQIVMVWVALLAQEMLLVVYAGLFGRPEDGRSFGTATSTRRVDTRFVLVGVLRAVLLGAGVVWALAVLAEWTTINPASAGAGYWFQWVVQHWVVAGFAVAVALFPAGTLSAMHRLRRGAGWVIPTLVGLGGITLLLGVPPPLPAWGIDGLLNQVLGSAGAPVAWGASAPGAVGGWALLIRWGFEYVLLGGFATVSTLLPTRVSSTFVGTVRPEVHNSGGRPAPVSTAGGRTIDARVTSPSHPEFP
jgi:hypothetical protein